MESNKFRPLESQVIYRDSVLGFRKDKVLTPNNAVIEREVVEYHPSSAIVAVEPEKGILLIKHFRYPIHRHRRYIWEIPGGMRKEGESGERCAMRELAEETGYEVSGVKHLITFFPEPAFTDQIIELYVGTIEESGYHPHSQIGEEEIQEVRVFPFDEIKDMMRCGQIASSWSIIGLLLVFEGHYDAIRK